jgi:hypothetical protein
VTSQTPRGRRTLSAGGSSSLQGARVIPSAVMIGRRILYVWQVAADAWRCGKCGACFRTFRAAAVHARHAHGEPR